MRRLWLPGLMLWLGRLKMGCDFDAGGGSVSQAGGMVLEALGRRFNTDLHR